MSVKLAGITERLNGQQEVMAAQAAENEGLRAQLARVGDVVRLSEEVKAGYDGEVARLRGDLTKQVRLGARAPEKAPHEFGMRARARGSPERGRAQLELGKAAAEGLVAERERADTYMAQLAEQQGGVKKLLASHKETHAALNKSTALNKVCAPACLPGWRRLLRLPRCAWQVRPSALASGKVTSQKGAPCRS